MRAGIEAHIARPSDQGLVLAIDLDGELVGTVNVAVGEHRQGEIGFMLHPDHQGHGYATEAAEAIVELTFGTYGLHRVCASVEPRNTASVRVLERLGMRKEAHLIETGLVKGEGSSEAVYAILAREWRAARECRRAAGGSTTPVNAATPAAARVEVPWGAAAPRPEPLRDDPDPDRDRQRQPKIGPAPRRTRPRPPVPRARC